MHDSYQILIKHVPWIKKLNNIRNMQMQWNSKINCLNFNKNKSGKNLVEMDG